MNRVLGVRIVRWQVKLLFVFGVWLVGFPIQLGLDLSNPPEVARSLINALTTVGFFILGARWFRGLGEPVAPARPWWKMTARRRLSAVLGVVFVLVVVSEIALIVSGALGLNSSLRTLERIGGFHLAAIDGSAALVLAFLYVNSAVRLSRWPTPAREPKLRPPIKLR